MTTHTVLAVAVLLGAVLIHELAHAGVTLAQGHRISGFYIGIPLSVPLRIAKRRRTLSTIVYRFRIRDVDIGISWLLLGGAIVTDTQVMSLRQRLMMYLAGPLMNLLGALVVAMIVLGPSEGWQVTGAFLDASVQAILLLSNGQIPIAEVSGPIAVVEVTQRIIEIEPGLGLLFSWLLINTSLALTNILPIPALDGGQCVTALLTHRAGEGGKRLAHVMNMGGFYVLLAFMISLVIRDLLI